MELIHVFVEFSSLGRDIFERLIVIAVTLGLKADLARYLELVEHIALTDFIGMKLKAERSNADLLQTLINNIESCLLLSSEKHLLAARKTVGNYRCDCL